MKTLYGLILIVSFATIMFVSVSNINNQAIINNDNLDEESLTLISKYDKGVENLSNYKDLDRPDTTLGSNQTSQVDAFFREYAEAKDNVDKVRDGINYIFDIPEIIIISIPFINANDTALTLFKAVFWLFMTFIVVLVIYKAVRGGRVDNE